MKLTCPACGAAASAEAWENDAHVRQFARVLTALPQAVSVRALGYIALFRPAGGRGLAWSKALRLITELREEVGRPTIQWQRGVARPNTAAAWGSAMERVIACPPRRLPLKSHGYLKAIAYEIADELDKAGEREKVKGERNGTYVRRPAAAQEPCRPDFDAIRRQIRSGKNRLDSRVRGNDDQTTKGSEP